MFVGSNSSYSQPFYPPQDVSHSGLSPQVENTGSIPKQPEELSDNEKSLKRVADLLSSPKGEIHENYENFIERGRENPRDFTMDMENLFKILEASKAGANEEVNHSEHHMEHIVIGATEKSDHTAERTIRILKTFTSSEPVVLRSEEIGEGGSILASLLLTTEFLHWSKSQKKIKKLNEELTALIKEQKKLSSNPNLKEKSDCHYLNLKSKIQKIEAEVKKEKQKSEHHVRITATKMLIQGITDTKETVALINSVFTFSPRISDILSIFAGAVGLFGGVVSTLFLTYLTKKNFDKRHALDKKITEIQEVKDAFNTETKKPDLKKIEQINKIVDAKLSALEESKARNKRSIIQNLSSYSVCALSITGGSLVLAGLASGGTVLAAASAIAIGILFYSVGLVAYENRHQLHKLRKRVWTQIKIKALNARVCFNEKQLSATNKIFGTSFSPINNLNRSTERKIMYLNKKIEPLNKEEAKLAEEVDDLRIANAIGLTDDADGTKEQKLQALRETTIREIIKDKDDPESQQALMTLLSKDGILPTLFFGSPLTTEATIHFLTHHAEGYTEA